MTVKNILFIMCDQLRWDYLSCYGHPHLETPNIDALAARGVRFDRAYVQSPVCGPSRMSTYTGRYVHSHGASWNFVPLKAGEMTIGDHLRPSGVKSVLIGKTHMRADTAGMTRLGIDPDSQIGVRISECGFDPFERDDGIHPYSGHDPDPTYNNYLRARNLGGDNPWEEWANAAEDEDGDLLSGWFLKNANRPARVPDEHSETPYITSRAMDFIDQAGDQPWVAHVSYIKPHWPYIVPEPYASMYGPEHILPVSRSEAERSDPHPVFGAMQDHRVSRNFARDEVRERVIPAYMGLIKQIDDQMGRLFQHLEDRGIADETMIVFTSDHGDYLGDHWMGDKDLFHEQAIRVPLIIHDPDPRAHATRGTVNTDLIEMVDLAPTFLDVYGGAPVPHVMDGQSLRPALFGQDAAKRDHVICEYDYSFQDARLTLGTKSRDSWLRMIFDGRWKYVIAEGYRPMLFDLENDPEEFHDLGGETGHEDTIARLHEALFRWARQPRQRVTVADGAIESTFVQERIAEGGILIGYWDEAELEHAVREEWHPRFAAANPIIGPTLKKLLRKSDERKTS
ncbi:sulfatase-like hydrolase/transferase [Phaeobacter gallaeciensis]|jgi:arylsulfatase A-like enzyme|uniref:sulfatase-like hydrolase/transferase n=1 Tax=Phaeobacter gallaeciensis TaxID=60890 RepID=UPI001A1B2096|nr:sulfatase-like hydrolase/transferase [Phaeobacter gallaeciensis]MBK0328857.1 sulfatase-like hydrolase/transferase [Rhodobacteraceae bacterium F11138]MDE4063544.1 sulfatase-like hydrolase/transferase [Phaeobacter gallaeciensis]MDE4126674.1 sulfatase-like hydrolase/transferase [Phaeobacter gallaeciensis]MDE4131041.1 sulfatase-like hydrolase/transferase [Phaeobacter gallaeciensis]|tara:strand:- start:9836 stop:11533 length:1698 start_codon:yes stop_codon:yes gene_type:complete